MLGGRVVRAADRYSDDTSGFEALTCDVGFTLRRDPDTVRAPDVAFVTPQNLAPQLLTGRFYEGAPDIAVEVISESQSRTEVESKVAEYLEAGGRLVWVIDPEARVARVYRPCGEVDEVPADGVLSGEDVIPGLRVPLSDVFR
jgi:Uma2 family endonuclease